MIFCARCHRGTQSGAPASRSWMAVRSCGRRRARFDFLAIGTMLQKKYLLRLRAHFHVVCL